jgi:DNA processing protein
MLLSEVQEILLHLNVVKFAAQGKILELLAYLAMPKTQFYCIQDRIDAVKASSGLREKLLRLAEKDLIKFGFHENTASKIIDGIRDTSLLEKEKQLIQKHDVSLLTIVDDDYPELLKNINSPPMILYYQGSMPSPMKNSLAIVGARAANVYAKNALELIIPPLIAHDWNIVSGGALGVDTMAHEAALQNGGSTVVVLGSGLLRPYPYRNKKLFDTIAYKHGAIVSPFPLEMRPDRFNFPARNRIISGLSKGCLVVQAAQKSGSLITAHFALEQGRQVFAVPGSIFDPLSQGCHKILMQGAKPVSTAVDILEEFQASVTMVQKGIDFVAPFKPAKVVQDPFLAYLQDPKSIDDLCTKFSLALDQMQNKLFDLQLEGKIKQTPAGLWESN